MGCFTDPRVFEFEEAKGQSEGAPSPGYCAASRTELPPGRPLASAALPEKRQKKGRFNRKHNTRRTEEESAGSHILTHTHFPFSLQERKRPI